ncbi:MAG: endonuclease [Bacteroidetes bacterium]|nr:endonuclease [Bacteroidota bacterium]MBU1717788.1 endonuclease [Bacteroidota bacterium]
MRRIFAFLFFAFLLTGNIYSQDNQVATGFIDEPRKDGARFVFYNVENLFHPSDDSLTNDGDFTPTGIKGWSYGRYRKKLNNIYKTLINVGGWEPPDVVGFCEVESRKCMDDLLSKTPLGKFNYKIIHQESPDRRGIDVCCIYRPSKFQPVYFQAIHVFFPFEMSSKTRDILYIKGTLLNRDTIHLFYNHWPSRYGGYVETIPKRNYAASVLKAFTDSLLKVNPNANLVIMGDFNDYPDDESINKVLMASHDTTTLKPAGLYNLMYEKHKAGKEGSHKFHEHWGVLDQVIVSAPLLMRKDGLVIFPLFSVQIYRSDFLLQPDEKFLGVTTFRTYYGATYLGGYSDHLPIYIDLKYTQ